MIKNLSWKKALAGEFEAPYFKELMAFVEAERATKEIFPPEAQVFQAFEMTPFEEVKVVILGQDPYHTRGRAEGLAFSVPKGAPLPPSLRNIYKELEADLGIKAKTCGSLEGWAKQGVLLLNTTLTVRAGQALSHAGRGWETFTGRVVQILAQEERPLIFVLWGNHAKAMYEKWAPVSASANPKHLILTSAHPSPFSAAKFLGTKPFSSINNFLTKHQLAPINFAIS